MAGKEAKKEEKAAEAPAEAAKSGGAKMIVILVVAVLVSMAIAGGGVWFFMSKHQKGAATAEVKLPDKAIYYDMTPAFTVTLTDPATGNLRYMQAGVTIMTRVAKVQDDLKSYDPEIRNNLNQLFATYKPADLVTASGREQLEKKALATVNAVLEKETGRKNGCESFLFTSFVVQ